LKPQESTQISAMIQIPTLPGHYTAGFRLEKNGRPFGPKLWVDVQAIPEDNENENENKIENQNQNQNQNENENESENENENETENAKNSNKTQEIKSVVTCLCGEPMIETSPMIAYYEGAEANCDLCGEHCPTGSLIYHCSSENTEKHRGGYDLCNNCARSQMQSFEQPQEQKKEPILSKPEEPKLPKAEEPAPVSDPLNEFMYQEEARTLVAMGFNDLEHIKRLLVSNKGNVDAVVAEMVQQ